MNVAKYSVADVHVHTQELTVDIVIDYDSINISDMLDGGNSRVTGSVVFDGGNAEYANNDRIFDGGNAEYGTIIG